MVNSNDLSIDQTQLIADKCGTCLVVYQTQLFVNIFQPFLHLCQANRLIPIIYQGQIQLLMEECEGAEICERYDDQNWKIYPDQLGHLILMAEQMLANHSYSFYVSSDDPRFCLAVFSNHPKFNSEQAISIIDSIHVNS